MDSKFDAICGITEEELYQYFAEPLTSGQLFTINGQYLVDIPFDCLYWSPYEGSEEDNIVRNEKLKRLIDEVEYELEKETYLRNRRVV